MSVTSPFTLSCLLAASLTLAAFALALAGCGGAPAGDDAAKKLESTALPVRVAAAAGGTVIEGLAVQGRLEVWRQEILSIEAPGTITELPFQANQAVKKGELIAQLVPLADDKEGEERTAAKLLHATRDLARREALAKTAPETISLADLDIARDLVTDSQLEMRIYQERDLKRKLVAPFDGVLTTLAGTLGQQVAVGFQIAVLLDTGHFRLGLDLPETSLRRMNEKQPVEITALADGTTAKGSISILPHAIDATKGSGHVLVDVVQPPASWRPGGFVTARLVLGETKAELVLPRDAILYRENRPYAWVAEEHEGKLVARRAWLDLGAGDPTRLIITKGVNPGDQVVVEGMAGLSDGIPVSIRADDAAAAAVEKPPTSEKKQ